ncbi:hypothetical protein D3C71_1919310 [compost metagenome]
MGTHSYSEATRWEAIDIHVAEVSSEFGDGLGDICKPVLRFLMHPHAAEVIIASPIAKPAGHLEKGVIGFGVSIEVADT